MTKTQRKVVLASAIALAAIPIAVITGLLGAAWAAGSPECPSTWPDEPQPAEVRADRYGQISGGGFHTDSHGERWYIIRATDSNGNTTARAYPADDRYSLGYAPASPDETCYAKLGRSGDDDHGRIPSKSSSRGNGRIPRLPTV